jgi:hypothetical protein
VDLDGVPDGEGGEVRDVVEHRPPVHEPWP